jgi:predicted MFS family arabinose efflux permease
VSGGGKTRDSTSSEPASSPVTTYRQLFRLAGRRYVVVAFLGRLPQAMSQLGTLLLVAGTTGSYAAGGASAGALAMAGAVASLGSGALADRFGQRRVVLVQSLLAAASLIAVVALSRAGVPWTVQAAAAAIAGFTMPLVGPLARVRWRPITKVAPSQPARLVDAAFSYEGAADEASFVVGPALVGAIAAVVDPAAALVAAAILLAVFGSLFATHRTADLVGGRGRKVGSADGRLPVFVVAVLGGAQLVIGTIFGSVQTGTTALATEAGVPGAAGLLHALLGVGSVLAGLAVTSIPERIGYEARLIVFAVGLVVLSAPLLAVDSLGSLAAVLLVMGLAVAPYMITVFTLAEQHTPSGRTGSVMTLLAGSTGLGYAIGSTIAGRLTDSFGYAAAFAVPLVAGVVASLLVAGAYRRLRARADAPGAPTSTARAPAADSGGQLPSVAQQRSASNA